MLLWGTKRRVSLLIYTCTSLPTVDLVSLQNKSLAFQKQPRLLRTLFCKTMLPGLKVHQYYQWVLLFPASKTDFHKEQMITVRRACESCLYPEALKTEAQSSSELSACIASSAPQSLTHHRAVVWRHLCSAVSLSVSSSSLFPHHFTDISSIHIWRGIASTQLYFGEF